MATVSQLLSLARANLAQLTADIQNAEAESPAGVAAKVDALASRVEVAVSAIGDVKVLLGAGPSGGTDTSTGTGVARATVTPTLPSFVAGTAAGTQIAELSAIPAGCTRTVSGDGRVVADTAQRSLRVGVTAHTAGTSFSVRVTDTPTAGGTAAVLDVQVSVTAIYVAPVAGLPDVIDLNFEADTNSAGGSAMSVVTGTRDATGLLVQPAVAGGGTKNQLNPAPGDYRGRPFPGPVADSDWYNDALTVTDIGQDTLDARWRQARISGVKTARLSFGAIRAAGIAKAHTISVWYKAGSRAAGLNRARIHIQTFSGTPGLSVIAGPVGALVHTTTDPSANCGTVADVVNTDLGGGYWRIDCHFTPSSRMGSSEMGIGIGPDGDDGSSQSGTGDVIVLAANYFDSLTPFGPYVDEVGSVAGTGAAQAAVTGQLKGIALAAHQAANSGIEFNPAGLVSIDAAGLITATGAGGRVRYLYLSQRAATVPLVGPNRQTDSAGVSFGFQLGVNLAGADFGSIYGLGNGPSDPYGPIGREYAYPDNNQADYFIGRGLKAIRIPFKWERVQPIRGGPLRTADINELDRIVQRVHDAGGWPIIDMHNYFVRYEGGNYDKKIIRSHIPQAEFNDIWRKLANRYKHLPRVVFNLMNEPVDAPTRAMCDAFNSATVEIRATGSKNMLMIPGNHYTGAHSWVHSDNNDVMIDFYDSENNWCYDMHQYLDADGGYPGRLPDATPGAGASVLVAATTELRRVGRRAFLGEFNTGPGAQSAIELKALLDYMSANRDVWCGGTWWMATNRLSAGDDVYDADPASFTSPVDRHMVTAMRRTLGLA